MATEKSSASAHPSTEDYDDTVEAHYSGLEHLRQQQQSEEESR